MTAKRVLLVVPPFSGHLHPMLGIAKRVSEVANVTLVSTESGAALATRCSLRARTILEGEEAKVWAITEPGTSVRGNPLLLYRQLKANVALMGRMKTDLSRVIGEEKPDVVIADFTVPVAGIAAQEHGARWWTVLPSPCVLETRDGPPAYFGGQSPANGLRGQLLHAGLRTATRVFKRLMFALFRREFRALGFSAIYRGDGSEAVYSAERIFGLGMKEVEFARSYPASFELVGPVLFTPEEERPAPQWHDGRATVLITLGTHLAHKKRELAELMRDIAARHLEMDFHFSHGKAGVATSPPSQNFSEHDFISYAEHLAHYDAVVHHGGSGVMYRCLQHGKPAVVLPIDYDQFDNAARLAACGAGIRVGKMSEIEAALMRVINDQRMATRCAELGSQLRQYDAPGRIATEVTALVQSPR